MKEGTVTKQKTWVQRWKKMLKRDYHLILLCVPALIFIFIFDYGPMYGIQIAFKDYNSDWESGEAIGWDLNILNGSSVPLTSGHC